MQSNNTNKKYNMQEQLPYESTKPMYLVDDVDNMELLKEIILDTCKGLPNKKFKGVWCIMENLELERLNYKRCLQIDWKRENVGRTNLWC